MVSVLKRKHGCKGGFIMKKSLWIILVVSVIMMTTACGKTDKTYDLDTLAESVVEKVKFDDTLASLDLMVLSAYYGLDSEAIEKGIVYKGSGATAEEFILLKMKTAEDGKKATEALNQYIENQKEAFSSYVPAEVKRLENAYVLNEGVYVFVCVATDTEPFKTLVE